MSETLRSRDIDELLEIIGCTADGELDRKLARFRRRVKLRRILCFLLRKTDDTPSDEFFRYITEPVRTKPCRIYPCRLK